MNLLLDTHLLLWAAGFQPSQKAMRPEAVALITDETNALFFSAASIWEVAIKSSLGRDDFAADPHVLRRGLADNGYVELAVSGEHAAAVSLLPPIHKDPFDRMLIAQAIVEGITLVTADAKIGQYEGPIRRV